jgi:hypothetical protein
MQDRAHFFAPSSAPTRTPTQAVSTKGLFPSEDGIFATPYRETLFTGKATANLTPRST